MTDLLIQAPALQVSRVTPQAQLLLHCAPEDWEVLASETGLSLGSQMLRATQGNAWHALHLAPDEWLLIGPTGSEDRLGERFSRSNTPRSLVTVSDRTLGIALVGAGAERVINSGCPLDLEISRFPVGCCTRTLFGKVMVVLWRTSEAAFRMEYARSFDEYVTGLVETSVSDLPELPEKSL